MDWLKGISDNLTKILDKAPYLIFLFLGGLFLLTSLVTKWNYEFTRNFFLYAVSGTIWRYADKDFLRIAKDSNNTNLKLKVHTVYHTGNIILLFLFLISLFLS